MLYPFQNEPDIVYFVCTLAEHRFIDGFAYDSLRLATYGTLAINKNQITNINPDDIETIAVLKNETAVYLYGDKAKYGEIIITTKKVKDKSDKIQKE